MHKNRLHFIRGISLLPLGLLFVKVASLVSLLGLRELAPSYSRTTFLLSRVHTSTETHKTLKISSKSKVNVERFFNFSVALVIMYIFVSQLPWNTTILVSMVTW